MSASGLLGSRVEASRDGISTMGLRGFWAMGAGRSSILRAELRPAPRLSCGVMPHGSRRYSGRRSGVPRARINHISFELSAKIRFLPCGAGPAWGGAGAASVIPEGTRNVVVRDQQNRGLGAAGADCGVGLGPAGEQANRA